MKKNFNRNRLGKHILKIGENKGKVIFYTNMSELDKKSYGPKNTNNGFYFIIRMDNKDVKFYQSGDYPNVFSDEYTVQALIFTPKEEQYRNVELHIINDYE